MSYRKLVWEYSLLHSWQHFSQVSLCSWARCVFTGGCFLLARILEDIILKLRTNHWFSPHPLSLPNSAAASQCTTGSLQLDESVFLSNGTIAAGLLLVCRDGVWGTIQADTSSLFWSEKNALVACRSLGFNGALNTVPATQ